LVASGPEGLTEGQAGRRQHQSAHAEEEVCRSQEQKDRPNRRWQNICEEDVRGLAPVAIPIPIPIPIPPTVHT